MPFYYHLQDFQEYFINSITESYALTFWPMHFIVKTAEVVQNVPYLPFTITVKPSGLTFLPWVRKRTVQHSCLKNPMDGGAWWAAVHGVAKSRTRLSNCPFTFHFSCIGEGNGNPLQCSCLEKPRDGGAWWAAVYGVAQSQTLLKQLSSSSEWNFHLRHIFPDPWCGQSFWF